MRPVRLVAEGFTAFRDRVEVDFEDVDFFALVGPTGSGKSSVIDAICFALYGCVPRYEDRRLVAPAITVGASEAKVSLVFDVGGERYHATRVVRRQPRGAGATTREARLERHEAGSAEGDPLETLAGNADQLSAAVEALLGLSFEQFTRCVVLPQGEFAKFLHDKPADRQELLARLLDIDVYSRMGGRARSLAEACRKTVEFKSERLDTLGGATPEALAAAERRVGELSLLGEQLRDAEPAIEQLARDAAVELDAAARAEAFVTALVAVAVPAEVVTAAQHRRELEEAVARADTEVATAETRRRELAQAATTLPELAPLQAVWHAHDEMERLTGEIVETLRRLQSAEDSYTRAERAAAAAEEDERLAAAGLESARLEHGAANLAQHLAVGQPCPVCLVGVTKLPALGPPGELAAAERRLSQAKAAAKAADRMLTAATEARAEERTRGESLVTRQQELNERVAEHPDRDALVELVASVDAQLQELAAARSAEEELRDRRAEAVRLVDEARQGLASTRRRRSPASATS